MPLQPQQILPTIMLVLSAMASVVYLCHLDYRRSLYWASAAVIAAVVTY